MTHFHFSWLFYKGSLLSEQSEENGKQNYVEKEKVAILAYVATFGRKEAITYPWKVLKRRQTFARKSEYFLALTDDSVTLVAMSAVASDAETENEFCWSTVEKKWVETGSNLKIRIPITLSVFVFLPGRTHRLGLESSKYCQSSKNQIQNIDKAMKSRRMKIG